MRRISIVLGVVLLIVVGLGLTLRLALGQAPGPGHGYRVVESQTVDDDQHVVYAPADSAAPDNPTISSFSTQTPYCYQPDPAQNACYINFYRHYVESAPAPNMRYMTITIESRIRAVYRGFFQDSMYVGYDMQSPGFKVACGALNSGGVATMGKSYAYSIEVRDSQNGWSGNYGTLNCPAYVP
ncbi:MAG: hypothetical protein MUF84_09660 [Anaerolineae bacterium]|jgi:hypothetical protein|nr:hypothetical protein [Anaerolineae bacterium]